MAKWRWEENPKSKFLDFYIGNELIIFIPTAGLQYSANVGNVGDVYLLDHGRRWIRIGSYGNVEKAKSAVEKAFS